MYSIFSHIMVPSERTTSPSEEAGYDYDWIHTASIEDMHIYSTFRAGKEGESDAYAGWVEKATSPHSNPRTTGAALLRSLYPDRKLVMFENIDILSFPKAKCTPGKEDELFRNLKFIPSQARKNGSIPGELSANVEYGCFKVEWDNREFLLYQITYLEGLWRAYQQFLICDGEDGEASANELLKAAGSWSLELMEEIFVFTDGYWSKEHDLWLEVQTANWDDVILDEEFKRRLRKDVSGFFDSEETYKRLAIPWKRGIILYGPPGNGKTISLKAVMKTAQDQGHYPLYVRTFKNFFGDEYAMQKVFSQARLLAPCVLILEDLDNMINPSNRSFFLNQIDGITPNNGVLVIATTNFLEKLDPALSKRPSRFDRKFEFLDPSKGERLMYAKYWQAKLADNKDIDFPDSLAEEVANITYDFSFAFLKECFVSTLVLLTDDENKLTFEHVLKGQIQELRKQLEEKDQTSSCRPEPHFRGELYPFGRSIVRRKLGSTFLTEGQMHQCAMHF